jgi:hypothetical protein
MGESRPRPQESHRMASTSVPVSNRDLRARDDEERELRQRMEAARVVQTSLGHGPVSAITPRDVEALSEGVGGDATRRAARLAQG